MNSRTIEYLTDEMLRGVYLPGVATAFAVALVCAILSPLVVLKRLSFVGQGVSHAAFGGVGVALVLGMVFAQGADSDLAITIIVAVFCIAAALAIAWLTDRADIRADTAIGIVLVASMAVGFLLLQFAGEWRSVRGLSPAPSLESILFGSIFDVTTSAALTAWLASAVIIVVVWATRRRIIFWAYDEAAAEAFGLPTTRVKILVMVLLALTIVMTMKLAGLILATALLVLPGAAAVQLSRSSAGVTAWSVVLCLGALVVGIITSFELNLQVGPTVVVVLTLGFAGAKAIAVVRARRPDQVVTTS